MLTFDFEKLDAAQNSYNKLKENCEKEKGSILSVETYCDILFEEYKKLVAR